MYKLAGPSPEMRAEQLDTFFAGLPADSLTQEEVDLSDALHGFLAGCNLRNLPRLSNAGTDPAVGSARALLLEQGSFKVPLKEWIARRIGGEISLEHEEKNGQWMIHAVGARHSAQPNKGNGKGGGKAPPEPVKGKGKGGGKAPPEPVKGKGKGVGKAPAAADIPDDNTGRCLPPEDREEIAERFFSELPADALTDVEVQLRDALLAHYLERIQAGALPTLSEVGAVGNLKSLRTQFLPREISFRKWIERRVGDDIEVVQQEEADCGRETFYGPRGMIDSESWLQLGFIFYFLVASYCGYLL
ncbi:unnamed protein product [Polarella glacialis]|uniref:Uncharacterized protein n=1 Tax=Polarella glacialis TaxID=89957 RepID=A0A813ELB0_POLGL|nr:unnamed protein product [Polarella glacialis]